MLSQRQGRSDNLGHTRGEYLGSREQNLPQLRTSRPGRMLRAHDNERAGKEIAVR
jgi:hypothetical protein